MITVIVIDDHPIVRAGIRAVLDSADDIRVVAEAATGAEALRLVVEHKPQVLVLDVSLPDINGLEVARQLCARHPSTAILILTAHGDRQTVFSLLECGAIGYVLKDEALETLAHAVRAAARGESWLSPAVASQVIRRALEPLAQPAQADSAECEAANLTPREIEVLRWLAQGLDNTAIAEKLVLTTRTVQNHVSNIYGKLGLSSRTEAALYAIRRGLAQVSGETAHDP
jgi:NarL family two-component system response regulator LiaR